MMELFIIITRAMLDDKQIERLFHRRCYMDDVCNNLADLIKRRLGKENLAIYIKYLPSVNKYCEPKLIAPLGKNGPRKDILELDEALADDILSTVCNTLE